MLLIKAVKRNLFFLIAVLLFINCNKKDNACMAVAPQDEAGKMASFCNANNIDYTIDSSGIFYQVIALGTGITPNENSTITVTYTTSTLDGNVVEDNSANPVTKPLSDFIEGWRIALPYIRKGGRIKMVVPSSLAYGCTGISNLIAPDSPLYYDIVLRDVQ